MGTATANSGGLLGAVHAAAKLAMQSAFGDAVSESDPVVRASEFADFQLNGALPLARVLKKSPAVIAQEIVAHMDLAGVIAAAEVAGPGYINVTVSPVWLAANLAELVRVPPVGAGQTVVIDYSSPNVAKEMHVGHIRTTIIGDALARILEHDGAHVIRQNHIGDWGTPFGMLIEYYLTQQAAGEADDILAADPDAFYQAARRAYDTSPRFAERARARVVLLQARDAATIDLWEQLVARSVAYFSDIYARLNVSLTPEDIMGESAYDAQLAAVCDELVTLGLAVMSDGALCVFPAGYMNREGQSLPLMLRKRDGGYTYAATDLAAAKYRLQVLGADQVLYVVGEAQALHLSMVFDTVSAAGWNARGAELVHVQIGNMLGADGKLLRTRSGESAKLASLVDDAVAAAQAVLAGSDLTAQQQAVAAQQVGVGALKYADLSLDHATSYTFDLQRMVALTGNTGPYLQYTCVRINSILRQAAVAADTTLVLPTVEEKNLAVALANQQVAFVAAGTGFAPHVLCAHLFNVAQMFSRFYTQQQVLKEADAAVRASRLLLCQLTLTSLAEGLAALGIQVPERM